VDYINANNLAGAMVWSLDMDDFKNKFCGQGNYPLINLIKSRLNFSPVKTTTTTTKSTIVTTIITQTPNVTRTTTTPKVTTTTPKVTTTTPTTTKSTSTTKTPKLTTTTTTIKSSTARTTPKVTTTTKTTPTTTKSSVVTSTSTQNKVTTKTPSGGICVNGDGYYPDYTSGCKNFFQCVHTGLDIAQIYTIPCPTGTLFDKNYGVCNWEAQVTCIPSV
jgi:hypothetical protein